MVNLTPGSSLFSALSQGLTADERRPATRPAAAQEDQRRRQIIEDFRARRSGASSSPDAVERAKADIRALKDEARFAREAHTGRGGAHDGDGPAFRRPGQILDIRV